MIGVGLIGTGFMGKCHALAWNSVGTVFGDTPEIKLVHLGEANTDLATKRAREFGFAKASGDWRAVIADPEVDIVSITAPNQFHPEMAIEALKAGKHVWCEKPMAPAFAEAEAMTKAARHSGKVAVLGYNYIQSPALRHIRTLLDEKVIGDINHLRIEMDEDFMADPEALFFWKHEAASGYGALDDFAVHPLSLVSKLFGRVSRVMRLESGMSATLLVNRSAWGRKGRIAIQIFGSKGSIVFDQERFNELQLYVTSDRATEQGYRTIMMAPQHKPYDRFIPAPGHGLGFNDLKTIECRELIDRLAGKPAHVVDFDEGLEIERTVHAMAQSFAESAWLDVRE
jgi:predicted dehydrogenase